MANSSNLNNDPSMFSDKPSNGGAEKGNANGDNGGGTGKATNGDKKPVNKKAKLKSYRYPYDRIENDMDYLRIKVAEYKAPLADGFPKGLSELKLTEDKTKVDDSGYGVNKSALKQIAESTGTKANRPGLKNPIYQMVLPIPQQISDISAIDWTDGKMNPLEAYGLAATSSIIKQGGQGAIEAGRAAIDFLNQAGKDLQTASGNANIQDALIAAISGQAIGALGGNVSANSIIARATGQVLNPNLELLFNGVNLRVFPFTFEFFPRNRNEAVEVRNIIKALKYSMLPSKNGSEGVFISAPYVFQLEYMKGNKKHPFLNHFLPMALTNMSVSYTGSNTYSTFYDGSPTHIRMDVVFKELNPIYKEDHDLLGDDDTTVGY
jgi:hypothetical protein|tara:strand:+ start:410 stop:1543 length:1134 start_codon:yes stop_codon:yes gene_type:complete